MNIYTFHRVDGFYPLELKDDEEAIKNAKINKGTIKVVNINNGNTIFGK